MRVTQGMMATSFMQNLSNNLNRLMKQQNMLSSTKKVSRPSDDPVAAALAMRLRENISSIEQYGKNVDNALTWMKSTETALSNVNDVLQRVRELTLQATNGTNGPDDRLKILDEITQLKEQIFQEANSSYAGRYLFAGYHTDKAPFAKDADGKIVLIADMLKPVDAYILSSGGTGILDSSQIDMTNLDAAFTTGKYAIKVENYNDIAKTADISIYQIQDDGAEVLMVGPTNVSTNTDAVSIDGKFTLNLGDNPIVAEGTATVLLSSGQIDYDIGSNTRITVNTSGKDVFVDIFKTMEDLETALQNDDQDGLSSSLTDIDNSISIILKYRSQIGARMNRMEATRNRLDTNSIDYKELLSNTEDIDIAEVIMNLKMEENIYRASLSTGARIIQPNLADFLR